MSLKILVQHLSGEVVELDNAAADGDIRSLKRVAAGHFLLPAKCINFMRDGMLLEDDEKLRSGIEDLPEPLTLALCDSAEPLIDELESSTTCDAKLEVVHDLRLLGKGCGDRAVAAVLASVQKDMDARLLPPVLETLCFIATQGDKSVIAFAGACLRGSFDDDVNVHALQCLHQIACPGDEQVIAVLEHFLVNALGNLYHTNWLVFMAGLRSLLAAPSPPQSTATANLEHYCTARAALLDHICIQNPNVKVATVAASALKQLCVRADAEVVSLSVALAASTHDPNVLLAVASVCQVGDETVLQSLRLRLGSGHWPMRRAALQALAAATPRDSQNMCDLLKKCISTDISAEVCVTAVELLGLLSEPGDKHVTEFLEGEREEQAFEVQMAIDDALESLLLIEGQA